MKIKCPCGPLIVDNTDFLPYKARRVADRDGEDLLFADDDVDVVRNAYELSSSMWQCTRGGRLCLDDRDHQLHWFVPEDPDVLPRRLLSSVHGARWKGQLRGHWDSDNRFGPSGRLWWSWRRRRGLGGGHLPRRAGASLRRGVRPAARRGPAPLGLPAGGRGHHPQLAGAGRPERWVSRPDLGPGRARHDLLGAT